MALKPGEKVKMLGQTERALNTTSPTWVHKISFDYNQADPMWISVNICDGVVPGGQKSIGEAVIAVKDVLGMSYDSVFRVGSCSDLDCCSDISVFLLFTSTKANGTSQVKICDVRTAKSGSTLALRM